MTMTGAVVVPAQIVDVAMPNVKATRGSKIVVPAALFPTWSWYGTLFESAMEPFATGAGFAVWGISKYVDAVKFVEDALTKVCLAVQEFALAIFNAQSDTAALPL